MGSLHLSTEDREKLLELAGCFFSELTSIFFSDEDIIRFVVWNGEYKEGNTQHLILYKEPADYTIIHWYEFCIRHLPFRICKDMYKDDSYYPDFIRNLIDDGILQNPIKVLEKYLK